MKVNVSRVLFRAVFWQSSLLAAAGLPGPKAATAQQVEVIAETVLRLDPSASSPVIAALPTGTVLEWVGESGPYFAVSVPGPPGQENLVGYVLASEVSVVGGPQPAAGNQPLGAGGGGMPIPNVQQQHATAKQSRSAGMNRAAQGAALAATAQLSVSIFFEAEERNSYEDEAAYEAAKDREGTATSVKNVALVGAAALAAYGIGRSVFGWRRMAELEREFPEATTQPLDRQYAEATLNRSLGKRKVFWGVFLAAASFATVEYVPHFAEPQEEDFEDVMEFQSAADRQDKASTVKNWVMGVGGVLGGWGVAQWVLASQKMGEVEELSRITALVRPLEANLFVGRAGARTQLGVAWSW